MKTIARTLLFLLIAFPAFHSLAQDYKTHPTFDKLRTQALAATSQELKIPDAKPDQPLVAMMEIGLKGGVGSIVVAADGAVSVYVSSGYTVIGAGQHETARVEGGKFLQLAGKYMGKMSKTSTYPLPDEGFTRFYLVTDGGVYTMEARSDDMEKADNELFPLFYQGNIAMSEVRKLDEAREDAKENPP